MAYLKSEYFAISLPRPFVAHVEIIRESRMNAFFDLMWLDIRRIFDQLSYDPEVRAIVFSGAGARAFTAGLDVHAAASDGILQPGKQTDPGRRAKAIRKDVREIQDCVNSIERCEKPVICVLHGISFGLAIDLACCCDIRICSSDVKLSVKEVDVGLAADLGTLNRLPKIVRSFGWVKDVCMSARVFGAEEAYQAGFVNYVASTKQGAMDEAFRLADVYASKSPVAVQGTKELLNHSLDHSIHDSLRYTGIWNTAAVQSEDVTRAVLSGVKKKTPTFEKL